LHYVGCAQDGGGVLAVLRTLAAAGDFRSVLGVSPGFQPCVPAKLRHCVLLSLAGETISVGNVWRAAWLALALRCRMRRRPRFVVHGHSRAGLLVVLWLRLLGASRVVATVHVLGRQRWFYRWASRLLGERLVWLGPAMKQHYRMGGASWSGCLPDCVPLPAALAPRRPRAPGSPVIFGCVGALVPVKRWELVLQALARLPAAAPVSVIHAGSEDGSPGSAAYAGALRRQAAASGVATRLEWRGEVRDMATFYAEIDCLLVVSRWEASSMAALEALAAGIPVLASAESGTRDLLAAGRGGWLFPDGSADALAARMTALATGLELAAWQPDRTALQAFDAMRVAGEYARLYQRLLSP
jgi:glycosyltransferase involved in cell wall biosynthesis